MTQSPRSGTDRAGPLGSELQHRKRNFDAQIVFKKAMGWWVAEHEFLPQTRPQIVCRFLCPLPASAHYRRLLGLPEE
jgi:hypothetical protein